MRPLLLALLLVACSPCIEEPSDAAMQDSGPQDACACVEPYRCVWTAPNITVDEGYCIVCLTNDGGEVFVQDSGWPTCISTPYQ